MMTNNRWVISGVAAVLLGIGLWRAVPVIRGIWPAWGPAAPVPTVAGSPSPAVSGPALPVAPLTAAPGWKAFLLTDDVPGARDMALDAFGNVWVSQPSEGTVSLVYLKDTNPGVPPVVSSVLRDLDRPHGLVFDPANGFSLYVAEVTRIIRVATYGDGAPEHVADLPAGGRHFTRSLAFGPDARLYVSLGSTCDVCYEAHPEIATVISMNRDGSDRRTEATGLRNAVFIAFHPQFTESLWTTEMGRDRLGDNLPPDEINVIDVGGVTEDYGWPICYGNHVHDADFDKNQYIRDPCEDTVPPLIELPAHVAPLGLAFLDDGDLLVAYHGSWNSTVPVGYKVVRWHWDGTGWTSSDFLTGFLLNGSAFGRPVDVLPMPDGSVLVSDDKAGAIWKMMRTE
ncbi:MAG TPA: PQQ-dependent sugar dehydrogenase [Candidatus Paceibacterota bacterium]|nr:PQQ-dependent sugar dehydrogenase [Candidatus Paceibacterota bacterium]